MEEVFLLQNQSGFFLSKQQEWVDGRQASILYKTAYKDEAINTKVELTVKAADLRIKLIGCALNDKGLPVIPAELLPEILPTLEPAREEGAYAPSDDTGTYIDANTHNTSLSEINSASSVAERQPTAEIYGESSNQEAP